MKIIAVTNQKGGVGKTTTAQHVGIGLVKQFHKRVLLVDADPQGSLTMAMGYKNNEAAKHTRTLYDLIMSVIQEDSNNDGKSIFSQQQQQKTEQIDYANAIVHTEEGADLIICDVRLAQIERDLLDTMNQEKVLQRVLDGLAPSYDYAIIDCQPSLGLLTINALSTATDVLIPCLAQPLSQDGFGELVKTMAKVRRNINRKMAIAGVAYTMVTPRASIARKTMEEMQEEYPGLYAFKTLLPVTVKAQEATKAGMSIYKYAPKTKLAHAYEELTKEVAERV